MEKQIKKAPQQCIYRIAKIWLTLITPQQIKLSLD